MKKRQLTIEEYKNIAGVHTIIINNARYQKNFQHTVEKLIKTFSFETEVFFGFCRTDGMNLSSVQQKKLKKEIPALFRENGDYQSLSEYLTVAKIKLNDYNCSYVPLIFDYYLETVMFTPKVDWEIFKQYHSAYQEHRFEEIILNHFADILFYYYDSGDFLVCFDPETYSPIEVRSMIDLFFCM